MTRARPKITKGADGWQVAIPAFGFASATVKTGFRSREAAGRWLRQSSIGASDGTAIERCWTPRPRWTDEGWPVVIR